MKRIGIFGFAANPPHINHWIIAEQARAQFQLDWVYIVPAGGSLDKPELADKELRWKMTVADCQDDPTMRPLRLEIDRDGPSYTHTTLEELRQIHSGEEVEFFLIIGRDRAGNLARWYRAADIIKMCTVLVAPRNCAHKSVSESWLRRVLPKGTKFGRIVVDYSSTWIRGRVAAGNSVRYIMRDAARKVLEAEGGDTYKPVRGMAAQSDVCCNGTSSTRSSGGKSGRRTKGERQ